MASGSPIACSLSPNEMSTRLDEMAAIGRTALRSASLEAGRAVILFRADARTRARLSAIVAAEAQCCAFLDMEIHENRGSLALTITAPPDAEPVLQELVAAFGAREHTGGGR